MNARRKIFFLAGQLGLMIMVRFFFQWIIKYSTTVAPDDLAETGNVTVEAANSSGMIGTALFSATAVGGLFFAFRVFDGVTDPIAGGISDWWARKGRERRRLLWYSFFLPPLGLALCFAPNHAMDPSTRWAFLVCGMFVFFVGYTLYCIPYWSLVSDYSEGKEENKRSMSTLLGAGVLLATAVGFVISPMVIDAYGYSKSSIIFAAVSIGMLILPYYAKPAGEPPVPSTEEPIPVLQAVKQAFAHRKFAGLVFLLAGSQMSLTIMTGAAPFIAIDLLNGSEKDVALLMGPFLGVAIPCFLFTPWISRKLGWEKALVFASLGLGAVYCTTGGLGAALIGSPLTTAMVLFCLGGPMVAVLLGLEGEGITICAEERGGESVSIYWGVFNFVVKALNGIALWICGILATRVAMTEGVLTGTAAIRGMSFIAGGFLALGVIVYYVLKAKIWYY